MEEVSLEEFPFQDIVVLEKLIEVADYPEIVRFCMAHPPTCADQWVKRKIKEKRAQFIDFVAGLSQDELKS